MKIMMVTPYFYPKIGGLENYALNIALGLKKQGHEVFVVTSNHESKEYIDEKVKGLRVIRLPATFKFSNTPIGLRWRSQLKKIIKTEKPDVINAHSPVPGLADIAIRVAGKIPTSLTYHAASLKKDGSVLFNIVAAVYDTVQQKTFRKATSIIAVSDYVKECLPEKYQEKTLIVYNSIDLSVVSKKQSQKIFDRLIFVGSLDQTHSWKGLEQTLQAVQIVAMTNPDIELVVLGDGDKREEYELQCKELGIERNVVFKGFVTGPKKYEFIRSAQAIIAYPTSQNDAFPTVFLEAWACKTVIVAASIGALPYLIEDKKSGYLVAPNNPKKLASQLLAIHPSEAKDITRTGFSLVSSTMTWQFAVEKTEDLLDALAPQKQAKEIVYAVNFPISNTLAPSIHVHEVCNNLSTMGYQVTLATPYVDKYIKTKYQIHEVRYPRLLTPVCYQLFLAIALIKLLKSRRKVLYVRQEPFMFAPQLVAKVLKVTLIVETNGMIEDEVLNNKDLPLREIFRKIKLFYFVEKTAYSSAAKIITVTPGLKRYLVDKYNLDPTKVVVVENGVNVDELRPMAPKNQPRHILGFVGGLEKYQGINYMIEAFSTVTKRLPDAQLHIYGSGPEKQNLVSQVEGLKLEKNVKFKGVVKHESVSKTVSTFSTCIAYYTNERSGMNSPFKVLEYLSCGKPVLLSNLPGFKEVFGDVVELVKPQNSEELAREVEKSLLRADQNSDKRRKFIIKRYSWTRVCKDIDQTIQGIS